MKKLKAAVREGLNRLGFDLVRLSSDQGSVGISELFEAAKGGEGSHIESLLRQGIDPNVRKADGVTPLILAAAGNHVHAIEVLLANGADPNLTSSEGWYPYHFAKNAKKNEAADILLKAHGGVEPVFDYASDYIKRFTPAQTAIYERLFTREALNLKKFINIGSGNWRHPYWTNVDYASDYYDYDDNLIDIPWDISLLKPLAVESDYAELMYCSHTVEHLTDEQDRFMFREANRILKSGGVFRLTCPNIELYYQACIRRDPFVRQHYGVSEAMDSTERMPIWFVNEIATQLVQDMDGHEAPLRSKLDEIDAALKNMAMEDACNYFSSLIDYEIQRKFPGNHINWWTNSKMCRELRAAGFSETIVSVPGACVSPAMRDRMFFDTVNPTFSLFVDAIK